MIDSLTAAAASYKYLRTQCCLRPMDACVDAAQYHNIKATVLANYLALCGIDAAKLSLM